MIKESIKNYSIEYSGLELVLSVFMEIWISEDIRGPPIKFLWIWKFDFSTICPDLTTHLETPQQKRLHA